LTDDRTKQHLKVILEITEVREGTAFTRFKVFEANQGYLHSKVRKGMSKVDYIGFLNFPDGRVRVKIMAVTHKNIKSRREGRYLQG